jgi:alanyl-tRNA synthetase
MDSNTLRARFLAFFEGRGHAVVPSAPLVPANDPTLLFTNAGMVQFKEVFLGHEQRGYTRAVSSQRCVRAGGKHNDLENVGYTARHHTFFEMLGNFSFGDYFKREAIELAWEFITASDWLAIPAERLLVTVYETDDEAYKVWRDVIGLPPDRVLRIGDNPGGGSDNFWQMGDTGPCGPCSEIFYDHGPGIAGGPPGAPDAHGDRWVEIWNLVFMQYDRAADGALSALPAPSVDTGMGLERLAAVMQGVHDNYDIDLFRRLIAAVKDITGAGDTVGSHKVIADHIRAAAFLIADGITPSNEGRGYVLRRIVRRAIRHGYKLGVSDPFFHKLVAPLAMVMGQAYPELEEKRAYLERVLRQEEDSFAQTLDKGMRLLEEAIAQADGGVIPGPTVFKLYDTYGFPMDLTADIARERGLSVDSAGFEREMDQQRQRARAASGFAADYHKAEAVGVTSEFTGYQQSAHAARVTALLRDGQAVEQLGAGEEGVVLLDRTPFYAESGGQVGDTGVLTAPGTRFEVRDTRAVQPGAPGHVGTLTSGSLRVGDHVKAEIDDERRLRIMRNHSATHLLHAALRRVLGTHVQQKGSLVAPDRLRFDFSHLQAVTPEESTRIEQLVNEQILANVETGVALCGYQEALARGAIALFGEKYGDTVRVLSFGDFSTELCGGTHVTRTGDIGLFKIVSESGVAAGVRRIEAVTGTGALDYVRGLEQKYQYALRLFGASASDFESKLAAAVEERKALTKELQQVKDKLTTHSGGDLAAQARDVGGVRVLAVQVDGADNAGLRTLLDQLKQKFGTAVIVLGSTADGKVALVAGVTSDLHARIKAGDVVNHVAAQVGGKGGGRPDMAQAGGSEPDKLPAALDSVYAWVEGRLGG